MSKTLSSILIVILGGAQQAVAQTTWFVPATVPTIQGAISQAAPGDSIFVNAGTYAELLDFMGKDIRVTATQGPSQTTILNPVVMAGATPTVAFRSGESRNAILEGFRIESHGMFAANAVRIDGASPTLRDCVVRSFGSDDSVGVRSTAGGPAIIGCDVSDHFSLPFGTGVSITDGAPALIEDCRIANNGGDSGGGIVIRNNNATIRSCTLEDNATDYTGNLSISQADVLIQNCRLLRGGSVSLAVLNASHVRVTTTLIAGNSGGFGLGSAVRVSASLLELEHCTVVANDSAYPSSPDAGGIVVDSTGTLRMGNSIVWANHPQQIDVTSGSVQVTHSHVQGGWPGTGNQSAAPGFIAFGDWRLRPDSGCVDTAGPSSLPLLQRDLDDHPRSLYVATDRGCFEMLPPHSVNLRIDKPTPTTIRLEVRALSPNLTQVTLVSTDSRNQGSLSAGGGQFGGLWIDPVAVIAQLSLAQAPFVSGLGSGGFATWSAPIPPSLSGLQISAVSHSISNLTGTIVGVSDIQHATL